MESEPHDCSFCSVSHAFLCSVFETPTLLSTATHSCSHPRNITWHAAQGRSMIPAQSIPSVLAIRLLPFPNSPLGPLSETYIRSFCSQRDDRAIKWTANDRQSGTSPLAVSPPRQWGRQLNQSCYLPYEAKRRDQADLSGCVLKVPFVWTVTPVGHSLGFII